MSKTRQFLPADVILKHVGWFSDCVFRKYYRSITIDHLYKCVPFFVFHIGCVHNCFEVSCVNRKYVATI